MRVVRMLVLLAVLVFVAVWVQENSGQVVTLTLFGRVLFGGISAPVLMLVSLLAGALLILPVALSARRGKPAGTGKKGAAGGRDGDKLGK